MVPDLCLTSLILENVMEINACLQKSLNFTSNSAIQVTHIVPFVFCFSQLQQDPLMSLSNYHMCTKPIQSFLAINYPWYWCITNGSSRFLVVTISYYQRLRLHWYFLHYHWNLIGDHSNYEPSNRSNGLLHQRSWTYRGCWHQTCPPIVSFKFICNFIIFLPSSMQNYFKLLSPLILIG